MASIPTKSSTTPTPPSDEDKRKYLEFIQNVITRMNSNSFMIKGWAVTIVTALFALFASTKQFSFLIICILPIVLFAWLDTYYLQMERKFRKLYEEAITSGSTLSLYNLDIGTIPSTGKYHSWEVFKSNAIRPFYLFLLLLSLITIAVILSTSKLPDEKDALKVIVKDTLKLSVIDTVHVKGQDTLNKKLKEKK
jgi:hypothetical protein